MAKRSWPLSWRCKSSWSFVTGQSLQEGWGTVGWTDPTRQKVPQVNSREVHNEETSSGGWTFCSDLVFIIICEDFSCAVELFALFARISRVRSSYLHYLRGFLLCGRVICIICEDFSCAVELFALFARISRGSLLRGFARIIICEDFSRIIIARISRARSRYLHANAVT